MGPALHRPGPLRVDEVGMGLGFDGGDDGDELGGEGGGALEERPRTVRGVFIRGGVGVGGAGGGWGAVVEFGFLGEVEEFFGAFGVCHFKYCHYRA